MSELTRADYQLDEVSGRLMEAYEYAAKTRIKLQSARNGVAAFHTDGVRDVVDAGEVDRLIAMARELRDGIDAVCGRLG